MTSESVRLAAAGPDLNHRDPDYAVLQSETKQRLLNVYSQTQEGWHPYLLGGSGTLAVEAMVTSCIGNGRVLVLENGYYSSRIRDILEVHSIPYTALNHGWTKPWDFDSITVELEKGYEAVIGTHNETTTGRLNDVARLGTLCVRYGSRCLVDAMSSFGADSIDFTNLDAVCSSANKCLHSIPGVSFVLAKDSFSDVLSQIPRRTYYMSLPMYAGDNPPLTPPVPALAAFRQALRELPVGGAQDRHSDYVTKAEMIRQALVELGLVPAIPFEDTSCTLTTFTVPKGFSFESWFEANLAAGFVIYGCKGSFKDSYFQVSNMGDLALGDIQGWIDLVRRLIK